ncbi:hypothetical protein ACPOL_5015 [Acidisarcina polymorpha]|uniref:Class I SAM-dependent methyltransferase n=1 Tax=Acidisarcina polymorpha TaxID=2211140 RepID=A0A2Z5G6K9_9BACT|nr:class I SAM-dependent methyltransferase [Acidisarcina polymorpha]AXC14275.1 hypothetical protein ACPOL_5015 [Acidisarcina polymorpha]
MRLYGDRIQNAHDQNDPLLPVPAHFKQNLVENCKVFADRDEMLKALPKGKIWAEVGTYEGEFARKILDWCEPSHIDLMDLTYELVKAKGHVKESDRVTFNKGDSAKLLSSQPDGKYDYIYIDAGHDLIDVARDAVAAIPKLKPDGIIFFNDYIFFSVTGLRPFGTVPVVNALVATEEWEVVYFAFQNKMQCDIALQRTSVRKSANSNGHGALSSSSLS